MQHRRFSTSLTEAVSGAQERLKTKNIEKIACLHHQNIFTV